MEFDALVICDRRTEKFLIIFNISLYHKKSFNLMAGVFLSLPDTLMLDTAHPLVKLQNTELIFFPANTTTEEPFSYKA
jgi:hypothetical protein